MARVHKKTRRTLIKGPGELYVKMTTPDPCDEASIAYQQAQIRLIAHVSRLEIKTPTGTRSFKGSGQLELRFDDIEVAAEGFTDGLQRKNLPSRRKPGRPRSSKVDEAAALLQSGMSWAQIPSKIIQNFDLMDLVTQRDRRAQLQRAVGMRRWRERSQITKVS